MERDEAFQPLPHTPPDTPGGRIRFAVRLIVDLQVRTVYAHVRQFSRSVRGAVIDVGAGASPYRHLFAGAEYRPVDFPGAASAFHYDNPQVMMLTGAVIPFPDDRFDGLLCTEVLEHVEDPLPLVREMHRVLKPGGRGVVTIPWSARYHYIPYDYHRMTPSRLRALFAGFREAEIMQRGTDITAIAAKIIVAWVRLFLPRTRWALLITVPVALLLLPVVAGSVVLGHLSLLTGLGSSDDPLGYTIWLTK